MIFLASPGAEFKHLVESEAKAHGSTAADALLNGLTPAQVVALYYRPRAPDAPDVDRIAVVRDANRKLAAAGQAPRAPYWMWVPPPTRPR